MIKGMKQLVNSLNGLPLQFSDINMQKVHAKAAEPLVHEMHRRAPVGLTGNTADSVGLIKKGGKNREFGIVEAGPIRGGRYKGFAAHLQEFGTKNRRVKKRHPIFGYDRGRMPARPWVGPSWKATDSKVVKNIEKIYSEEVTKYLKRTVPK